MMKRIATSTKNVEQLPTQKEEGEDGEEAVSESELRDEVQRDSQLYKQRKVKRRSIDLRRGGPPIGPGANRADIHPELTMEKIQNPPDGRRGVLTSFGSRCS